MKSIEFSVPSSSSGRDDAETTTSGDESSRGKSLEVLLLEKNKTLQTENTQLKVAHSDLNSEYICTFVFCSELFFLCMRACAILKQLTLPGEDRRFSDR